MLTFAPPAFAAESVWSVEYVNSRKAEWEQLIGPTIRIEGRISSHGKGQLRLAKCELVFHATEAQLRQLSGKRTVELVGKLQKDDGKVSFEISQILVVPSDVEQFESRSIKLRNPRPADWYELGDWAAGRGRFYDDAEVTKKALTAYANGVKIEWRALPANDGEARIHLARKAQEYKLPDDQRMEILHEGYRVLWQTALKTEKPDPEIWTKLATRLATDLPGSTESLPQFPAELKQRYEKETLTLYREAPEPIRKQLHRLFHASVLLKSIESEAAADGRDGNVIADRIERAVPEEPALAEKYRDAQLAWRLKRAASATRQEIEQLASDYRSRQQPVLARQALQTWLQAREGRLREDGSLGLMQLADDHLALLKDENKAASFLKEAYKLDPTLAEVSRRLESLGYTLDRGAWTKEVAGKPAGDSPKPETTSTGDIVVGMTASALRTRMRPNSIGRAFTSTGLIEVWSYGTPGTSRLIVHLERTGPTGEAKVVEFGNER
ncbi:MAG: hypothetical protein AABP62_08690 [Planctomycetota bacterium]